jgi:leucyl aminopeptidase
MILEAVPSSDWKEVLSVFPEVADEGQQLGKPAKQVGDIILLSEKDVKLLVSLGVQEELSTNRIRKAGMAVASWLDNRQTPDVGLNAADLDSLGLKNGLEAFLEGLLLGSFRYHRFKSKAENSDQRALKVLINTSNDKQKDRISNTNKIMRGVNLAREWSHEPPNLMNPMTLADRARELAAETGLNCKVFGEDELSKMGAEAILSVGLGSKTPSQMIMLEHPGNGAGLGTAPIVVIGKAITFDTGGYSLKPKKSMLGMKFDKCGGMTIVGIMQAVAALNLPVPVIGIIAAAENMVSSNAYRPNDIIGSLSGKTIEIISTDAEGRMVLSDALTYASTKLAPRAIIDLATLTGGVVTALGKERAGLMSTDDTLAEALFAAGERTDERLWRLPLDPAYFELIKGGDSDLRNSAGSPQASAIVGGTFLKQFVIGDIPWAHIDIAGMATVKKGNNGARTATGFGTRLILDYLENLYG